MWNVMRLSAMGLAIALLALPATGVAKKKANPCAKKKAEKTGCVLKSAVYANTTGEPLFSLQTGSFTPPTRTILQVSYNGDACPANIRDFTLQAKALPKLGTPLKFSANTTLDDGSYTGSAKVTFTARTAKLTGNVTVKVPGQPDCTKTWSSTLGRTELN